MASTRSKKRKSNESQASLDIPNFPAPSQLVPTKNHTPTRTPVQRSPIKKTAQGITVNQKQALIDNLQLEITERARKLRAQYNLQAQGLRTRIEIRVNRIPMALRKANMGELFLKHDESSGKQNAAVPGPTIRNAIASPSRNLMQENQRRPQNSPSPMRPTKRHSDHIVDQENEDLSNPKKRTKAAIAAPRTTSRTKLQSEQVLSPRSANSRTLPRSPIRPASPAKSMLARPISPLKPMVPAAAGGAAAILTNMVQKAKSTRATATRKVTASSSASSTAGGGKVKAVPLAAPITKRGRGRPSNASRLSEASTGTTVVTKTTAAKQPPVKRTVMGTIKGIGAGARKAAPAKPAGTATATTGRVLRKRA